MHITIRQERTLSSERDSIWHHLGTLLAQEQLSSAPSRPRRILSALSTDTEIFICEFCNSQQHPTTERPNTPQLVYDHANTPPRLRPPQENPAHQATWLSLHRAPLHYLVSSVLRYFRVLHDDPIHRDNILQTIHNLLDIPPMAPSPPLSGHIDSHTEQSLDSPVSSHYPSGTLPPSLFDLDVAATVTRLRIASFPIHGINDPLLVTICEQFYSPLFGQTLKTIGLPSN
jgi:hypothetical protein